MDESASMAAHFEAVDRRIDSLYQSMGIFRARYATDVALEERVLIAYDLDCAIVKTLSIGDLVRMVDAADAAGIPANDLRRFKLAGIIMETARRDTGETRYIAVEISFNASERDASRAIRNAGLLRRFTGIEAVAVVAGVRKDCQVDADIAANRIMWYSLGEDDDDEYIETK